MTKIETCFSLSDFSIKSIDRLQKIFDTKFEQIDREVGVEFWLDLMDQHDCRVIDATEVADVFNFVENQNNILIDDPDDRSLGWILVPRETAKKILVLGELPFEKK